MADVAMPRLSDSMEEGTILKWLKSDGDEVKRGEELVEIETDKANMTYEADSDGTLTIVAQEGDSLPVGETIARLGDGSEGGGDDDAGGEEEQPAAEQEPEGESEDESAEDEAEDADEGDEAPEGDAEAEEKDDDEAKEPAPEPAPAAKGDAPEGDGDGNGRVKASPVAKRMAREMGLDLSGIEGSGPGGRIVKSDVEGASKGGAKAEKKADEPEEEKPQEKPAAKDEGAEAPAAKEEKPKADVPPPPVPTRVAEGGTAKGDVEHQDLSRLQQVVARRMAESKATAPEFVLNAEIDMEAARALRDELKQMALSSERPAPSFNDMVVKACALALRDFPRANGAYKDGRFELYSRVNVGIAVAGQDALIVPTIYDADRKSLGEIARDSRALAERVRANAITPPELSGGTFTVSNLGMFGIKSFTAVINPPQAAILAVGAMTPRAVVREGEVSVRHIMDVTLACDHRILYGADAAQFLGRIRELLEQPLAMAL